MAVLHALGLRSPLAPPCGRALPFGALWTTLPRPAEGPFKRDRLEQRYRAAREMVGVLPTGNRPGHGEELALLDAWGVAEAIRINRDPHAVPALTVQLRGAHVALYQAATAFFTPLYQSNAALPALVRDRLFAPASRLWPG